MTHLCVTTEKHVNLAGRNTVFVSQAAFDELDRSRKNLWVHVVMSREPFQVGRVICVAPSPEVKGDSAYFDQALCEFGKVSSGDKINFSLVETTWEDDFVSIKLSICQVSPSGTQVLGGNMTGLAARFRQLFCNTVMTKNQVLFLRHNDANWKVVVVDVQSRRRGSSWGVCDIQTGVSGVSAETTKGKQEVVQPSLEVAEFFHKNLTSIQSDIAKTTTVVHDLEAQLGEARARLASLNKDLQTLKSLQPPSQTSASTSMAFTEVEVATPNFGVQLANPGLVAPTKVYIVQKAHRNPHMKPVIVSTTFFEHLSDAQAAFYAYNKRHRLSREEKDDDNAFNLANTNVKCLELATNFDQVLDLYTMLGEVLSIPPNQATQESK